MTGPSFRRPFQPDRLNLVCLPQAGSDSALFLRWQEALGDDIAVQPVALPGRATRLDDPIPASLDALVDGVFADLAPLTGMPYALMGSSMGGWMAYELALRLSAMGLPWPRAVVVLTAHPPHADRILPRLDGLSREEVVAALVAFNPGVARAAEHPELLDMVLPAMLADFRLCTAYRPQVRRPLGVPLVTVAGAQDPIAGPQAMEGWADYADAGHEAHVVPGTHDLIEAPPAVLTDLIRRAMAAP
jgi:medium-chain acyl-[acyl-carrier-protein] hydrolase